MAELKFEDLPGVVNEIRSQNVEIKQILINLINPDSGRNDQWLNLTELCKYLPEKPKKATVYGWVSNNKIPFRKAAKKLVFLRKDIDSWLLDKYSSPKSDPSEFLIKRPKKKV